MNNNYTRLKSLLDRAKVRFNYFFEDPNPENMYDEPQREFAVSFNGYNSQFEFNNAINEAYNDFIYDSIIACLNKNTEYTQKLFDELSFIKRHIQEFSKQPLKHRNNSFSIEDPEYEKYLKHYNTDIKLSNTSKLIVLSEQFGDLGERVEIDKFINLQIRCLDKLCAFLSITEEKASSTTETCSASESAILMHYIFEELNLVHDKNIIH